jgi:hypothetical protein
VIAPTLGGLLVEHLGAHTPGYFCSAICFYLALLALSLCKSHKSKKSKTTENENHHTAMNKSNEMYHSSVSICIFLLREKNKKLM